MRISYLVTCKNEVTELDRVLHQLTMKVLDKSTGHNDEIVVLDDFTDNPATIEVLNKYAHNITRIQHALNGDFGEHKNYGSKRCVGDYIVQLDADEYLAPNLLENMHELLALNEEVELWRVPRVNIVRGLTPEDASKWGWKVYSLPQFPELPIINWEFDHQSRIYKNSLKIQWKKKLHETVVGAQAIGQLPLDPDFAIIHDKTIERQRAQNEFYNKNWSREANMGQG